MGPCRGRVCFRSLSDLKVLPGIRYPVACLLYFNTQFRDFPIRCGLSYSCQRITGRLQGADGYGVCC